MPDAETIEAVIEAAFWASLRREEGYTPRISLATSILAVRATNRKGKPGSRDLAFHKPPFTRPGWLRDYPGLLYDRRAVDIPQIHNARALTVRSQDLSSVRLFR